jgi:hypothetical protein
MIDVGNRAYGLCELINKNVQKGFYRSRFAIPGQVLSCNLNG